ncbi:MAG: hypothetical protein JNL28_08050 [Planctomycetes bacterium]|nr:hypothetical protein [Planctomycetota bacterium]
MTSALRVFVFLSIAVPGYAHHEFQTFVQAHSGRPVNCAMCHTSADGPEGTGPGQIGSLDELERERLNRARAAFDPSPVVDSPILNDFGNLIVARLGKRRILELRSNPAVLATELGNESDLDRDGIPDAREYLEGTHPLMRHHGAPLSLFAHELRANAFHVVMLGLATIITLYGLISILRGFALKMQAAANAEDH